MSKSRIPNWPFVLLALAAAAYGQRGALFAAAQSPGERAVIEASVTYSGCNEVRALGKAPLRAGQPGYREEMDGDGDGIACEPHHNAF